MLVPGSCSLKDFGFYLDVVHCAYKMFSSLGFVGCEEFVGWMDRTGWIACGGWPSLLIFIQFSFNGCETCALIMMKWRRNGWEMLMMWQRNNNHCEGTLIL